MDDDDNDNNHEEGEGEEENSTSTYSKKKHFGKVEKELKGWVKWQITYRPRKDVLKVLPPQSSPLLSPSRTTRPHSRTRNKSMNSKATPNLGAISNTTNRQDSANSTPRSAKDFGAPASHSAIRLVTISIFRRRFRIASTYGED
jgi:hypothetical protein